MSELHEHEHQHEHIHSHTHSHGGECGHDHTHQHGPEPVATDATTVPNDLEKTKALLTYMIHHNEHHTEELADLLDSLPEKASKKLLLAIGTFEAAYIQLQEVLETLV